MTNPIANATRFDIGYAIGWLSAKQETFSTVDVIRTILGRYHRDNGIPGGLSANAAFGKLLSAHQEEFRIERVPPDRNVPDDENVDTKSAIWRSRT
jgi:hypothetical protein